MSKLVYCQNGHFNGYLPERNPRLEFNGAFHDWQERGISDQLKQMSYCPKCGTENTYFCQHCKTPITDENEFAGTDRPAYCTACGKPLPWTVAGLNAAEEYMDELENLTLEQKTEFKATLKDLTSDTPRTSLAVLRFKKCIKQVSPAAGQQFVKIAGDIVTSAAKKELGI